MTKFAKLVRQLRAKGAKDPEAEAAYIGRRKYGKRKFELMAEAGKRRKARGAK